MMSDLNMSHEKTSDFLPFPWFGFTLVIELRHFDFESHWNTLILFDKKTHDVKYMSHEKTSDFVSFPLFGFTLIITLRNFDFESHWNNLIFFIKKWCQISICPVKQCLIWFKLYCLSKTLAEIRISWEIRILNFIEIV